MTDYSKLTVVKLRDELEKRGLPKAGLKAVLIDRLVENDEQSKKAKTASEVPNETISTPASDAPEGSTTPRDEAQPNVDNATKPEAVESAPSNAGQSSKLNQADSTNMHAAVQQPLSAQTQEQTDEKLALANNVIDTHIGDSSIKAEGSIPDQDVENETVNEATDKPRITRGNSIPITADLPEQAPSDNVLPAPTQIWSNGEETKEDNRKRKRRSLTPPPSSPDTFRKRAKADVSRPQVKLPEDVSMDDTPEAKPQDFKDGNSQDENLRGGPLLAETQSNGKPTKDEINAENSVTSVHEYEEKPPLTHKSSSPDELKEAQNAEKVEAHPVKGPSESPPKPPSSDPRFKNLLPPSSKRDLSPDPHALKSDPGDRAVRPALHPATSTLYIRDIMRPLNAANLKIHLVALATAPGTSPNPDLLLEFFLDSIRTHCLVKFANVSAASRVRSGLHDRVWPDEKNRKPLWVDFVPEEKLEKWIEVENTVSAGRGQAAKRWEVVYENEANGVNAYLQEVGSNGSGLRTTQVPAPRTESGHDVQSVPLRPMTKEPERPSSQSGPRIDGGKGFKALDDLFKSTTAKPKLYYLPVSDRIVARRLDQIAEGRGGGRSNEMRRYTFDDDVLVDRGPEFSRRGRGPRGSGSYQGGHFNRGGYREGYRTDYRGDYRGDFKGDYRGDSRRDYRGDFREEYRDDIRKDHRGNYRGDSRGAQRSDNRGFRGGFREDDVEDYRRTYREDPRADYRGSYQRERR
ncbi:MAG: hypothetical protein Q9167_006882 [Letrouitia subvulpina]